MKHLKVIAGWKGRHHYLAVEQKHTRYQEREIKASEVGRSVPGRALGDGI